MRTSMISRFRPTAPTAMLAPIGLKALIARAALALAVVPMAASAGGVDPNTFRVGHPASPSWQVPHANAEHPAVQVQKARQAGASQIDANTFRVQPPASVQWLAESPAAPRQLAQAR